MSTEEEKAYALLKKKYRIVPEGDLAKWLVDLFYNTSKPSINLII